MRAIMSKKLLALGICTLMLSIIFSSGCFEPYNSKDIPEGSITCIGATDNFYVVKVTEMSPNIGVTGITIVLYYSGNHYYLLSERLEETYGLIEGKVTFHDIDNNGKVSSEDIITVLKKIPDGKEIIPDNNITLKFDPTGDTICSTKLNNKTILDSKKYNNDNFWSITFTEQNNIINISTSELALSRYSSITWGEVQINANLSNNAEFNLSNITTSTEIFTEDGGKIFQNIKKISINNNSYTIFNYKWDLSEDYKPLREEKYIIKLIIDPNNKIKNVGLTAETSIYVVEVQDIMCSFDANLFITILTIALISIFSSSQNLKKKRS